MSGRPEDGYEVRSRIEGRSSWRGRLVTVVVAVLAGGWLIATVMNRPPTTASVSPGASRPAVAPSASDAATAPIATLPPAVERFSNLPEGAMPLLAQNLVWLGLSDGRWLTGSNALWTQFPFLLPSGLTICICLEPGTAATDPNLLRVVLYGSEGTEFGSSVIKGWSAESAHHGFFADVALTDDGLAAVVAVAAREGEAWVLRLDRIELWGGGPRLTASELIASFPIADLPTGALRGVRVWVSPDGATARIEAGAGPRTSLSPPDPPSAIRVVSLRDGEFGRELAPLEPGAGDGERCTPGGWATSDDFVSVCTTPSGGATGPEASIRRDSLDGSFDRVVIGNADELEDASWLLDSTAGVVLGWSAGSGHLFRVELPGLGVLSRHADLLGVAPLDVEGSRPPDRPTRAAWRAISPLVGPTSPIAGSIDGSVFYVAAGTTGIHVFDSETLQLVDRWEPGSYFALGVSADGRSVLGFTGQTRSEIGQFGYQGANLVFHDAETGDVELILRRLDQGLGTIPLFLVPQAGPELQLIGR